jgi:hypothetical protein
MRVTSPVCSAELALFHVSAYDCQQHTAGLACGPVGNDSQATGSRLKPMPALIDGWLITLYEVVL